MNVRSRRRCSSRTLAAVIGLIVLQLTIWQSADVHATGAQFQEPTGWMVGDLNSTFQEWDANLDFENPANAFSFSASNTQPSDEEALPALAPEISSAMGANLPGFVAGSGGYYAFGGTYVVEADIMNHGGEFGSGGPYGNDFGTRVLVQTAATLSTGGISVFPDEILEEEISGIEIVQLDGTPIAGGENESKLQSVQLFVGDVVTPIGIQAQEELLFEFWLPGYTDDFRVQFDVQQHASFQHLRVDTLIEEVASIDPDFNADGDVDGGDFLTWQSDPTGHSANEGLAAWQASYGSAAAVIAAVPEPCTAGLLLASLSAYVWRVPRSSASRKGILQ
ncbi:MAG: hypothetical protein AAGD11_19865 [Planctomycetota bacterium]